MYLTNQLVNSQDNSYYVLIERPDRRSLELYLEDRNVNRYARVRIEASKLKEGDEIRIKKKMFYRLRSSAKKKSGWQLISGGDSIVDGVSYHRLFFKPSKPGSKKGAPFYNHTFLLAQDEATFQTNLLREFPLDSWQATKDLPNGLIYEYVAYNPSGFGVSKTSLMKKTGMNIRLIIE